MQMSRLKTVVRVAVAATTAKEIVIAYSQEPEIQQNADLSEIITKVDTQEQETTAAINKQTAYSVQDEKDLVRDKIIRDLNKAINGYAAVPVEPFHSNGVDVATVFNSFGAGIADEPYAIESAHVNALLGQLEEPTIKAKTKILPGVDLLISDLKVAQAEFEIAYVAYETALANQKEASSASSLKPMLIATINDQLITYLKTMVMLKPALYTRFAGVVSQIIIRANSSVKRGGDSDSKDLPA